MQSRNLHPHWVAAKGRKMASAATKLADAASYAFLAVTLILAVTPILWTFLSSFVTTQPSSTFNGNQVIQDPSSGTNRIMACTFPAVSS